ncbi:hypothetical protein [Fluviispira multicolorata]|uniref:Endonuclease/Exonuclease/phosphatase family protein n=1 Tax=Fluviispira multicolorata TaxID=2654512 RepID=A0A833JCA6_9BACT|nr:hypothetical protein [Fluviispira multicolorata]KAB8029857.1 hypothetical protein GCL57_09980 [Fluviispira multicolorata]
MKKLLYKIIILLSISFQSAFSNVGKFSYDDEFKEKISDHKMYEVETHFKGKPLFIAEFNIWAPASLSGFMNLEGYKGGRIEPDLNARISKIVDRVYKFMSDHPNAFFALQEWRPQEMEQLKNKFVNTQFKILSAKNEGESFNNVIIYNSDKYVNLLNDIECPKELDYLVESESFIPKKLVPYFDSKSYESYARYQKQSPLNNLTWWTQDRSEDNNGKVKLGTQKGRFMQVKFKHKKTQEEIEIVNIHFKYSYKTNTNENQFEKVLQELVVYNDNNPNNKITVFNDERSQKEAKNKAVQELLNSHRNIILLGGYYENLENDTHELFYNATTHILRDGTLSSIVEVEKVEVEKVEVEKVEVEKVEVEKEKKAVHKLQTNYLVITKISDY